MNKNETPAYYRIWVVMQYFAKPYDHPYGRPRGADEAIQLTFGDKNKWRLITDNSKLARFQALSYYFCDAKTNHTWNGNRGAVEVNWIDQWLVKVKKC